MKKLLFVLIAAISVTACTTPVKLQTTGVGCAPCDTAIVSISGIRDTFYVNHPEHEELKRLFMKYVTRQ